MVNVIWFLIFVFKIFFWLGWLNGVILVENELDGNKNGWKWDEKIVFDVILKNYEWWMILFYYIKLKLMVWILICL